jgi:hypothetical protein
MVSLATELMSACGRLLTDLARLHDRAEIFCQTQNDSGYLAAGSLATYSVRKIVPKVSEEEQRSLVVRFLYDALVVRLSSLWSTLDVTFQMLGATLDSFSPELLSALSKAQSSQRTPSVACSLASKFDRVASMNSCGLADNQPASSDKVVSHPRTGLSRKAPASGLYHKRQRANSNSDDSGPEAGILKRRASHSNQSTEFGMLSQQRSPSQHLRSPGRRSRGSADGVLLPVESVKFERDCEGSWAELVQRVTRQFYNEPLPATVFGKHIVDTKFDLYGPFPDQLLHLISSSLAFLDDGITFERVSRQLLEEPRVPSSKAKLVKKEVAYSGPDFIAKYSSRGGQTTSSSQARFHDRKIQDLDFDRLRARHYGSVANTIVSTIINILATACLG